MEVTDDEHQDNGGQEKTEVDNEKEWGDLSQEERVKRALQTLCKQPEATASTSMHRK